MRRSLLISCAVPALFAGLGTTAFAADAPAAAPAADAPAATGGTAIADIVVTATRRQEKLQNVPVTVEAIGADQMRTQGITDFAQLVAQLPEVHAGGRGPGQNVITIRGLSVAQISLQASAVAGPDPNVAVYIDDASVALPGRNLDVYAADLERVEVLEGPQGTLFGASAEGGAIRYITNKPVLSDFHAGITVVGAATPGHEMSESVQGYINIPIIKDVLAVRVVGFVDRQGGYIDNVEGNYQMPQTGYNADGSVAFQLPADAVRPTINNAAYAKNDFNPATYSGGRISLKWKPNEDWTIDVQDMYQMLDAEGVFQYDPTVGTLDVQRYSPDYNKDRFNQVQWTVDGKIGKLGVIYSGSYLDRHVDQKFDYTHYTSVGPYVPYYICAPGYHSCQTPQMTYIDTERNTRLTQELRITTPHELRYRLQAGVYYDNTKIYETNEWYYPGAAANGFPGRLPGGDYVVDPSVRPAGAVYFNDGLRSESQFAVFGEAAIDITHTLTLTGGARWYDQKIGLQGSVNCGTPGDTDAPNVCANGNYGESLAGISPAHEHGVKPKVTLSWKPDRDVLIYATYSEGFRPGGFNRNGGASRVSSFQIPYTYSSDSVKNYEVGWKTQFFNHSLQWNGSAYLINWSNIPIAIYDPVISSSTFDVNGPDAQVKGITNDLTWRATRNWTFTGNVTYNHTALTKYGATPASFQYVPGENPTAFTMAALGSPLALSPRWSENVRVHYEQPVRQDLTFFAEYGAQFVSSEWTQDVLAYNTILRPYAMMDGSFGVKTPAWSAQIYVQNVADARPQLYVDKDDNLPLTTTARPRTIGLRLNYNY